MEMIKHIEKQLATRHRTKREVIESSINDRLNKSLLTYLDEISFKAQNISYKNELNVLKKL